MNGDEPTGSSSNNHPRTSSLCQFNLFEITLGSSIDHTFKKCIVDLYANTPTDLKVFTVHVKAILGVSILKIN